MLEEEGTPTESARAASSRLDPASATFWDRYYSASSSARQAFRLPYVGALDGIRALAVLAVLLYHAGYRWIPGGFLGVEIFFVLSGYLITSLLLAEWHSSGGIDLKSFWLRRARRLLPALFLLLIATLAYAVVVLPNEVAQLRADALAATFYVMNWWLIVDHKSYFEAVARPSLLKHLWSLAVEEQFYLVWPPIFVVAVTRFRQKRLFFGVLLGVIASTGLAAALYRPTIDPSRIYYGTDTRAAELLVGAALAFVWRPDASAGFGGRASTKMMTILDSRRRSWLVLEAVGVAAIVALGAALWRLGEFNPTLYRGGFLMVALATAALIAVVVHPKSRYLTRILGCPPLRWIGLRSYGIYLWHWPVYMITRPDLDVPLHGLRLLGLRVGLTLLLVEISYRVVETPFRSGQVGRLWRSVCGRSTGQPRLARAMWLGVSGTVAMSTLVLGIVVARAKPSGPPAYLAVQEVHISVTPTAAEPTPTLAATATPTSTATPPGNSIVNVATPPNLDGLVPLASPTAVPTISPTVTPTPVQTEVSAPLVTAVGDSVMVGAADDLVSMIPNLDLDAKVGMQVSEAIQILQSRLGSGDLGQAVVVDIGNNGPLSSDQFDTIMQIAGDDRRVIFLSVRVPRTWEAPNNEVLSAGVARYGNAFIVDWYGATAGHPELFWDDGIHLKPEGAQLYARLIAGVIAATQ